MVKAEAGKIETISQQPMPKAPPRPKPVAFSYWRLSSERQKKGDGLRRQLEETLAYCAEQGLQLDETLKDIGVSAFTGANRERGALRKFLDMVRTGRIPRGSHLIVESLDRLSRDKVMKAFRVFSEILEAGIIIHTFADRKIYTEQSVNENAGELIISITVMMAANEESRKKAFRQRQTWQKKRADAGEKKLTAKCPTWLELTPDRKTFKVIEYRARIIRRIFEETVDGIGCDKIARRLNQESIKPFAHGRLWHGGSVRTYLKSRAVRGWYQPCVTVAYMEDGERKTRREPSGDPIIDYYPQIVSDELWYRAWASIDTRRVGKPHNPAGRKGSILTNLFSGIGKCIRCRSPMNVRHRGESTRHRHKPFLICSSARNGICTNNYQHSLAPLEEAVLNFVQEVELRDAAPVEARFLELGIISKRAQADEIRDRIDERGEAIAQGAKTLVQKCIAEEAALEALEQEITRAEEQLAAIKGAVPLSDRQKAVRLLYKNMQEAEGAERYAIRSRLQQALREIITFMSFGLDGGVTLAVTGYQVGYRFEQGKLVRRLEQPLASTT